MTKLQSLVEVLQKDKSIQGLDQLIIENFYNQEEDEYNVEGTRYFILTENEVQDLLDNQFEEELYEASEILYEASQNLAHKGYYEIAKMVKNLDLDNNYFKAYKDSEKVNNYIFISKADNGNYYIYKE